MLRSPGGSRCAANAAAAFILHPSGMPHAVCCAEPNLNGALMQNLLGRLPQDPVRALADLEEELADFSYDGLVLLRHHLARGKVVRGSWAGCVISYKRGAPGSARRDRRGRARNAFTALWDSGWVTDEEVLGRVEAELLRRRATGRRPGRLGRVPRPASANSGRIPQ
jgi:hypothetical protein